jgi:thiosulfate/3-mercaptopyruvate sulfurtransferase
MRIGFAAAVALTGMLFPAVAQAERLTDKPLVDAAWLTENLGNESLVVLDIRDAVEGADPYAAGHVPGAVAAPYSVVPWRAKLNDIPGMLPPPEQIEATIAALGVDDDSQVVIIPAGTSASEFGSATRVYWTFKVLGHDAVTILDGGWAAWTKANGAVSTDVAALEPGDFKAEFKPELLADVAEVEAAIAGDVNLVDARSVAQFIGQEKTNTVQALGHIPTAVNINFDQFYDVQNASFASPETIAALLNQSGGASDDGLIAFCNTGHLASIAWFGLSEVQGIDKVRLYDGSMSQWTADPSRPVVTN